MNDECLAEVADLAAALGAADTVTDADDPVEQARQLLTRLGRLEDLLAATAAAQVRVTAKFVRVFATAEAHRRERLAAAAEASGADDFTVWRARNGRIQPGPGVGAQVALARGLSPHQGVRAVAFATTVAEEMPATLAALSAGRLSERRAQIVVRETSHLSVEDRGLVDAEVAGDPEVAGWGDREVERRTRSGAYRLDPEGAVERARAAAGERRVTIRPLPDTMCRVSALLPLAQGVATYAALRRDADSARAAGDPRTQGQVMADRLTTLVTGQGAAERVPVEVQVVISDAALLGTGPGADDPAQLPGYGPVPAGWVRGLLTSNSDDDDTTQARVWLRRLWASPDRRELVAMESGRRLFTGGLRRYLLTRDGTCRTPWCDAPIRHLDHVADHVRGGPTSEANGQGLCVRCNHTKQARGWQVEVIEARDGPHRVRWHTPTGLTFASPAPPLLPGSAPLHSDSPLEAALAAALAA